MQVIYAAAAFGLWYFLGCPVGAKLGTFAFLAAMPVVFWVGVSRA